AASASRRRRRQCVFAACGVDCLFLVRRVRIAGSITTDPLGSIALTGDQIAIVSGNVTAPGGNISLGGGTATYGGPPPLPLPGVAVCLTHPASWSVGATAERFSQRNGAIFDDVLPGGQVKISGNYIVLVPGSLIDVSGASGISTLQAAGSDAAVGGL